MVLGYLGGAAVSLEGVGREGELSVEGIQFPLAGVGGRCAGCTTDQTPLASVWRRGGA